MKIRLIFLCLLGAISSLLSQELIFEQFTSEHGLPSDNVYNLHQDRRGYIWVFTDRGAAKYNGNEFLPVLTNIGNGTPFIYCVYESPRGHMFVADSRANVYSVRNDSAILLKGINAMSEFLRAQSVSIYRLYEDDSTNLYVISKYSTYKLIPQNDEYQVKGLSTERIAPMTCGIYRIKDQIVPAFIGELRKKDYSLKHFTMHIMDHTRHNTYSVFCHSIATAPIQFNQFGDKLYFEIWNELFSIDSRGKTTCTDLHSNINNYHFDKQGNIWAACLNSGIYKLSGDSVIGHYLANKTVNDVLFDNQGGIWASTAGHGLFHSKSIDNYEYSNTDLEKGICQFRKIDSTVFIGTYNGSLYAYKDHALRKIPIMDNRNIMIFHDIVKIGNSYIISNLPFRVQKMDLSFKHLRIEKDMSSLGFENCVLKNRDTAWFYCIKKLGAITESSPSRDLKEFPTRINSILFYDKTRKLLVSTVSSLLLYEHDSIRPLYPHMPCKKINRCFGNIMVCDKDNRLFVFDTLSETLSPFVLQGGMPGGYINQFCSYKDSFLLLCTNKGLYARNIYEPADSWKLITKGNVTNVITEPDLVVSKNTSLTVLQNTALTTEQPLAPIYIHSILINDRLVTEPGLMHLSYKQNTIDFMFDVLDYKTSQKKLYFVLRGPINDSDYVNGVSVRLQNLEPGQYSLFVYNTNNLRFSRQVNFNIIPPFWDTPVFIILCIMGGIALILFFIALLVASARKKEKNKQEVEKLVAEYKITALKAQINPHFMSNSLSSIQLLIMENKTPEALSYIAKFSRLIRMVLGVSDKNLVPLQKELDLIALNIDLESLRFNQDFTPEIIIDPTIDKQYTFIPPLIEQPVIENAIWHGLIPLKQKAKKLKIEFRRSEKSLILTIEDNGVGYDPETREGRESKGLQITRERIEQINKTYPDHASSFHIKKLVENEEVLGTQIIFVLPLIISYDSPY